MALVSSHTIPLLLQLLQAGKLDTSMMITHGAIAIIFTNHAALCKSTG